MNYHIMANFPTNRDKPGILKVYDAQGKLVLGPVPALGRGSNDPQNNYNHADFMKPNSDIPTGTAETVLYNKSSNTKSFGEHERIWIRKGLTGDFLKAEQAGRSEIMIHGGLKTPSKNMPWYPLNPTYGCIRLSEEDQGKLVNIVRKLGGFGKLTVTNIK